jgi:hypothetical protein
MNDIPSNDDFGIFGKICQQQNIPGSSIFHGNEKVVDIFLKIQEPPSSSRGAWPCAST